MNWTLNKCECFAYQIGVPKNGSIFKPEDFKVILSATQPGWKSVNHPPIMQADPFLFVKDGKLFLFYEELLFEKGLGIIKMISTRDLINWTDPIQITHEEKTHFSYPFVFDHDGEVYMMPETGCDHNIRLYKATDSSLTKFEYFTTILTRECHQQHLDITYDYADSCIYQHNNKYYLFTSIYKGDNYILELYVSDEFDRGYTLHPCSPIDTGNRTARCGGAVFNYQGKIFRPCQDCMKTYGGQIHIMEIEELSPTAYVEKEMVTDLIPQRKKFFREGGHHFNPIKFGDQFIIAMDARFTTSFLLERIRYKIHKAIKR